jgi:ferrous iron transport protein A
MDNIIKTAHDLNRGETSTISNVIGSENMIVSLLKQGLTPGTLIEKKFSGTFGDPVAYSARGALIALRNEEAQCLQI